MFYLLANQVVKKDAPDAALELLSFQQFFSGSICQEVWVCDFMHYQLTKVLPITDLGQVRQLICSETKRTYEKQLLDRFDPADYPHLHRVADIQQALIKKGVYSLERQAAYCYFKKWFRVESGDYIGCDFVLYKKAEGGHSHSEYMVHVGQLTYSDALGLIKIAHNQKKKVLQFISEADTVREIKPVKHLCM